MFVTCRISTVIEQLASYNKQGRLVRRMIDDASRLVCHISLDASRHARGRSFPLPSNEHVPVSCVIIGVLLPSVSSAVQDVLRHRPADSCNVVASTIKQSSNSLLFPQIPEPNEQIDRLHAYPPSSHNNKAILSITQTQGSHPSRPISCTFPCHQPLRGLDHPKSAPYSQLHPSAYCSVTDVRKKNTTEPAI